MSANTVQHEQPYKSVQSDAELQAELLSVAVTPKQNTPTTKRNRAAMVLALIAIPLLYILVHIGNEWLNRTGIILNFCAGFMLAPHLIGDERLGLIGLGVQQSVSRFGGLLRIRRKHSYLLRTYLIASIMIFFTCVLVLGNENLKPNSQPWYLVKFAPFYIVYTGVSIVIVGGIFLIALLLSFSIKRLIGNEILKSTLKYWGIIFFIVGNLLQFISTF